MVYFFAYPKNNECLAQNNDVVNYIDSYKNAMNDCYYSFLPSIFQVKFFFNKKDTSIIFLNADSVKKSVNKSVSIFNNRLLDKKNNYNSFSNIRSVVGDELVKGERYNYEAISSSLTVSVESFDKLGHYFSEILYDKGLLKNIFINDKNSLAGIKVEFIYSEEFVNEKNLYKDTLVFAFDTIKFSFKNRLDNEYIPFWDIYFEYYQFQESASENIDIYRSKSVCSDEVYFSFFDEISKLLSVNDFVNDMVEFFYRVDPYKKIYFKIIADKYECSLY